VSSSAPDDAYPTPRNIEAERAVLGAVLIDNAALSAAATVLGPRDFFRVDHQLLFNAMLALAGRGEPIDLITVRQCLTPEALDRLGGPAYLTGLIDGLPHRMNVAHYARVLKRNAAARAVVSFCRRAITEFSRCPDELANGRGTLFLEVLRGAIDDARRSTQGVGLDPAHLTDATVVRDEGRQMAESGVRYLVKGLVPAYGTLGMNVAYSKVGKTTFAQQLGAAVAMGRPFLERATQQTRVLDLAAEDPPEYTAWLARHLEVAAGVMTIYRKPLQLDRTGLAEITSTVREGGYGLVLVSSWQAVVRELVRDENDNAAAVRVVEDVKAVTRELGVPWLIDAHSGKGEDQSDDADPSRAMRGASAAAAAADYALSLRYADGSFSARRRLTGKGRFVLCPPIVLEYDDASGAYALVGAQDKSVLADTTFQLLVEVGALSTTPQTIDAIAKAAGLANANHRVTSTHRRQVQNALHNREGIRRTSETRRGQPINLYALVEPS